MADYPTEPVIVLARLWQRMEALCPVSGEIMVFDREMTGLTKEMLVDYGDDWLDVMAADVPSGWLLKIAQAATLTSEQLPSVVDRVDPVGLSPWRPRNAALNAAKAQLRRFARLKRWGGSR